MERYFINLQMLDEFKILIISKIIWGRGCGLPDVSTEGINCVPFSVSSYSGHTCSCSSSHCNSVPSGQAMLTRAGSGIAGSGAQCHVCGGDLGVCGSLGDPGTVFDCGEGISTCMLGKSSEY